MANDGISTLLAGFQSLQQLGKQQEETASKKESERRKNALLGVQTIQQLSQSVPLSAEDAQKIQDSFTKGDAEALSGIAGVIAEAGGRIGANKREIESLQKQKLKGEVAELNKPFIQTREGKKFAAQLEIKSNAPKSLSAKDITNVNEGSLIPELLEDIKTTISQNQDVFGPIKGTVAGLNPYDTRAQTMDSQIRATSQAFGRYMEGGVLRKEDEIKYAKMFPKLGDTPQVAENKLANVNRLLVTKQRGLVDTLTKAGFDTSAVSFDTPLPDVPGIIRPGEQQFAGPLPPGTAALQPPLDQSPQLNVIPQAVAGPIAPQAGPPAGTAPEQMTREEKINFLRARGF